MPGQGLKPLRLGTSVLHLAEHGVVTALPMTPDFWTDMPAIFASGRMLSLIAHERDWPVWEMHPEGDEVIWLLTGRIHLHSEGRGSVEVQAGDCIIMPKGVWHTADVMEQGEALFLTEGAHTKHRPR